MKTRPALPPTPDELADLEALWDGLGEMVGEGGDLSVTKLDELATVDDQHRLTETQRAKLALTLKALRAARFQVHDLRRAIARSFPRGLSP